MEAADAAEPADVVEPADAQEADIEQPGDPAPAEPTDEALPVVTPTPEAPAALEVQP